MATSLRSIPCLRSGLVALLLASGACADDAPSIPTTSDTDSDTGTSTGEPPVTTIEPDSSGTMGTGSGESTRGEESTVGETMGETTMGETTMGETTTGGECGNGTLEDGEQCDTDDLDGQDCVTQGFAGGRLACADDCTFDTSSCTARTCGNGAVEGREQCDGADLDGQTCATQGFDGGNLACADDCTFDTSACTADSCGNGAIDAGETCDGAALGGETCVTQGFMGGALACAADCLGYDVSGCMGGGVCAHDICAEGDALDPTCDPCVTQICAMDAFCCDTMWDSICVDEVGTICGTPCGGVAVCGNAVIEAGEDCEGANLNGETCVTQGFMGGVLACAGDCSFDTAGCMGGGASNCCIANGMLGCDDAACEAAICGADPFCCDTQWDQICADAAVASCAVCSGGGAVCGDAVVTAPEVCDGANLNGQTCVTQGFPGGGVLACAAGCNAFDTAGCMGGGASNCCVANGMLGCDDAACEASICAADPFCCDTQWDQICADAAVASCAVCSGGGAVCGDGAVTAPEVCDGANLNGQTCVTQGFPGGGVLACAAGCNSFNTAGCIGGGGADCCASHMGTGCQNAACEAAICGADPFCCDTQWDNICANAADVSPACVGAGGTCP